MKHAYVVTKRMYVDRHRPDYRATATQVCVRVQPRVKTRLVGQKIRRAVDVLPLIVRWNLGFGAVNQ